MSVTSLCFEIVGSSISVGVEMRRSVSNREKSSHTPLDRFVLASRINIQMLNWWPNKKVPDSFTKIFVFGIRAAVVSACHDELDAYSGMRNRSFDVLRV